MRLGKAFFFFLSLFISTQVFGATVTITMNGSSFSPSAVNCNVGDVITWTGSFSAHIIQSTSVPGGAAAFGPTSTSITTFSYTVTVAGTYNYQCNIHAAMGMVGSFTASAGSSLVKGITLSAASIDFGKLRVGGSLNKTVLVNSVGPDAALTISSSPLSTGTLFSTSPTTTNRVINVGSSETETVTFHPNARGTFADVLTINNDATAPADQVKTVSLIGKGINGEFTGQSFIDFGELKVDSSKQITYDFTNTGDDDLFITSTSISGTGFSVVSFPSADIAAGAHGTVVVKFLPKAKKSYSENLTMTAQNSVIIPTILLTGTTPGPKLTTPATVNIGTVLVATPLPGSVILSNTGDDTLHVSSLTLTQSDTKYTLASGTGFKLSPGANDTVRLSYTSPAESIDTAILNINSDDLGSPLRKVKIIGRSGLPKMSLNTKDTINFGNVNVGSLGLTPLVIADTGLIDLQVQIAGFSPKEFGLENLPANVPAKGNATATLLFVPPIEGSDTGMAIVTGTDKNNSTDTIYMIGNGVHSPLTIPDTINFHTLVVSAKRDSVLTFKNTSGINEKINRYKLSDPNSGFVILDTSAHTFIASGNTLIKVRFAPTKPIIYSAMLSIYSNDIAPVRNIILYGNGDTAKVGSSKLSTDVTSIDFGTLDSGATLTKQFILSNKGTASATVSGVTLTGSSTFSKGTLTTPFNLLAGGSKAIPITFAPLAAGPFTGSVSINSSEGVPLTVNLQGVGKITVTGSVTAAKEYGLTIALSPNPVNGSATLQVTIAKSLDLQLDMYDAAGRLIRNLSHAWYGAGEFSLPIEMQSLPSGEYYIRAMTNGVHLAELKAIIIH